MNIDQILEALSLGESSDWEFKSAKGGFPGSFWPTYSGMGNTNGGVAVLGIKEKNGIFYIEGLTSDQIHSYQKILWDNLNNPSAVSRNLLSVHHVRVLKVGEKSLLVIEIPRATRTEGPIYIGITPFGNTYRRCHEGDYKCTDDQVRRMLADGSSVAADHRILRGFNLNDLDLLSLDQYRQRFLSTKPHHPWHSLPLQPFLEKLGGWRKDRESNEEGITLAAILMFGKHHSITDIGAVPSYFVDYREKLDPNVRWSHRIYPDGTWEPNLFQFYQKVWPHLSSDLKIPFHLDGIQRIDDTSVHTALREALVNTLIHSDYSASGGIVIERCRDRFILDNPGTLLVSLEQLRRGGISECRNRALQNMFMMIGGGEKAGSGIHQIQSEWKTQHWRAPAFSVDERSNRVRLVLPMVSLIPETTLASLERRFGSKFRNLKHLEVVALATADIEGDVSNTRLQELQTEHPAEITQVLQRLCSRGMLVSDNRRRWSSYRIPSSPYLAFNSPHLEPNSPHLEPNSPHLEPNSPHLEPNSPHLEPNSPHLESQDLEDLARSIANSKKASKQAVRDTILQLCRVRPISLEDLARLLHRSPKSLQNHYLTQLISEGVLELQYPEVPNHPVQGYVTKDRS